MSSANGNIACSRSTYAWIFGLSSFGIYADAPKNLANRSDQQRQTTVSHSLPLQFINQLPFRIGLLHIPLPQLPHRARHVVDLGNDAHQTRGVG